MNYALARTFARLGGFLALALGLIYFLFFSFFYPATFQWHWSGIVLGQILGWSSLIIWGLIYALCAALHAYLGNHCQAPKPLKADEAKRDPTPNEARAEVRANLQRARREARAVRPSDVPPPTE